MMHARRAIPILTIATLLAAGGVGFALAQSEVPSSEIEVQDPTLASEIDALKQTVLDRKAQVDALTDQMNRYKDQISKKEGEASNLQDELDLLTAKINRTNLDIQATQANIEAANAELKVLDAQINDVTRRLENQRDLIAALLRKLDASDEGFNLQLLFSSDSFAELFDRIQSLKNVNEDLLGAVKRAQLAKEQLAAARAQQQAKRDQLGTLAVSLSQARDLLEDESGSKNQLLAQTKESEARFQSLLQDVKRDQAQVTSQITALQDQIDRKLKQRNAQGATAFVWPVDASYRGISTLFHDPTYPFRHLFEHTGLDIPQKHGTPVHAAASGYVAWVRKGVDYGNYVMIIHEDGLATLYAHLSKQLVSVDQYVNQGDVIGLSGGTPGTPGAGLSTGAHLHFEVRKDGIPVNPLDYLPKRD